MNPVMVIRPGEGTGEISALLELWRASKQHERELLSAADIHWLSHLVEVVYGGSALAVVAERDGKTAGFMILEADTVSLLWVRPEARRTGVGTRLLGWALCKYPDLRVEVKRDNHQGITFYRALGFAPVVPAAPGQHAHGQRLWLGPRDDRMEP